MRKEISFIDGHLLVQQYFKKSGKLYLKKLNLEETIIFLLLNHWRLNQY